jgi:hypothetical protein
LDSTTAQYLKKPPKGLAFRSNPYPYQGASTLVLTKPDFDVAIIGGGPAGGSMGAYLAKAGVNCVVLERELFPRPHVGESLVPSAMRVFRDLDFLDQMEEAKFPHKFGAAWTAEDRGAYDMDFKGGFDGKGDNWPQPACRHQL